MTREKMLEALGTLPYALIWPGNWKDVGFTERELWINGLGYGYIQCDEPTAYWIGDKLDPEKLEQIKTKYDNNSLTYRDIEDTPIAELIENCFYHWNCNPDDQIEEDIGEYLELHDKAPDYIYALQTDMDLLFFATEAKFRERFERDWADVEWDSLDDDLLEEWIDRLLESDSVPAWADEFNRNAEYYDDCEIDITVFCHSDRGNGSLSFGKRCICKIPYVPDYDWISEKVHDCFRENYREFEEDIRHITELMNNDSNLSWDDAMHKAIGQFHISINANGNDYMVSKLDSDIDNTMAMLLSQI